MIREIRVPRLAATMETTELLEWVVKEGEKIDVRQVMVVLQTEKTSYEMESEHAGIIHIISPLNVTLPVTHVIALLAETQEEYEKIKSVTEPYEGLPD